MIVLLHLESNQNSFQNNLHDATNTILENGDILLIPVSGHYYRADVQSALKNGKPYSVLHDIMWRYTVRLYVWFHCIKCIFQIPQAWTHSGQGFEVTEPTVLKMIVFYGITDLVLSVILIRLVHMFSAKYVKLWSKVIFNLLHVEALLDSFFVHAFATE